MKKSFKNYLLLYIFIFILLIPAFDRKLHFLPVFETTEKRELAPRPNYSLSTPIPDLYHAFELFWNDNFGGRSLLIILRSKLWIKLFKESPVPYVTVGQNGWLFYKSEAKNDGPGINDYQGLTPLSEEKVKDIISSILDVKQKLSDRGIELIVTVAPNKSTIYADQLPPYIHRLRPLSRLDQLISKMPNEINFVDLRPDLIEGRSTFPTYQTTDSHWNNYGAFLATSTLISAIPKSYQINPSDISEYNIETKQIMGEGDLASMMSARGIFTDLWISLEEQRKTKIISDKFSTSQDEYTVSSYTIENSTAPRIAIFGDSFGEYLGQFFAPHFASTHIISFSNNYTLEDSLIELARPDILIWEVAERYVDRFEQ